MIREYLVNIHIEIPASMSSSELEELRRRERDVAELLAARGYLLRLWRVPGQWANWGLWRAKSEEELRTLLAALPLHPFMQIAVHPTEPHPSDPLGRQADMADPRTLSNTDITTACGTKSRPLRLR